MKKITANFAAMAGMALLSVSSYAQNPNFHIYLCFGQSNMEGQGTIEAKDKTVDSRFKVLSSVDCSNLGRTKGTWYTAVPPLCRCYTKLSPSDYFGRTMVANLPDSISVGVVNVAVGGSDIRLYDKTIYAGYDSTYKESWFLDAVKQYNNYPYNHLLELAKLAQKDGVIKGILLHQGETNTGDAQWPKYVKAIYDSLMKDLSLSPTNVPLLAGEVVSAEQNGCCSSMNSIINQLPQTITNSFVISSKGCPDVADNAHFSSEGYRMLGRRYAVQMLSLMGYEADYAEAECVATGSEWRILADKNASNASYLTVISEKGYTVQAPVDDSSTIAVRFTVSKDSTYHVYGRLNNASAQSDSYWVKIDNGSYELVENLVTTGWQWLPIKNLALTAGEHTIRIAICEPGTSIDKIALKNSAIAPVGVGEEATNVCVPTIYTPPVSDAMSANGYRLEQISPNPTSGITVFGFHIPHLDTVSLVITDASGNEIAQLAGKQFAQGKHSIDFNTSQLAPGIYFYTMTSGTFSATQSMVVSRK